MSYFEFEGATSSREFYELGLLPEHSKVKMLTGGAHRRCRGGCVYNAYSLDAEMKKCDVRHFGHVHCTQYIEESRTLDHIIAWPNSHLTFDAFDKYGVSECEIFYI